MSYDERLKYLNLLSLKYRRLRGDLIQMQTTNQFIRQTILNLLIFFTFSNITFTRGDKFKIIYIERCKTMLRQHYFVHRIVKTWNNTSFETKNAETLNGFKIALDREFINLRFDFDGSQLQLVTDVTDYRAFKDYIVSMLALNIMLCYVMCGFVAQWQTLRLVI